MLCGRTSAWAGCGWPCAAEQGEVLCVQGLCSPGAEPPLLPALPFPEPLCGDSHRLGMLPALLLALGLFPVGCRALLGLPRCFGASRWCCRTHEHYRGAAHPLGATLRSIPPGSHHTALPEPLCRREQQQEGSCLLPREKSILSSPSCREPRSRPCCARGAVGAGLQRGRGAPAVLASGSVGTGPGCRSRCHWAARAAGAAPPCRGCVRAVQGCARGACREALHLPGGAAGTWRAPNPGRRAARCLRGKGSVSWPAERSFEF